MTRPRKPANKKFQSLDYLWLIDEMRDTLAISMDGSEADDFDTVGGLGDYVHAHAHRYSQQAGKTLRSFFIIRSLMVTECGFLRSLIRPSTRLDLLFPLETRRKKWHILQYEVGFNVFPNLKYHLCIRPFYWYVILILLLTAFGIGRYVGSQTSWGLLFASGAVLALLCLIRDSRLIARFPEGTETVADLCRRLADRFWIPEEMPEDEARQLAYEAVCEIVANETNTDPYTIGRTLRLIDNS